MTRSFRSVLGVGFVLGGGLAAGFFLGNYGKKETEEALQKATRRSVEAEETLKREVEECSQAAQSARTTKQILLAREELLRAEIELFSNNFGLTSQHLSQARGWLKSAISGLPQNEKKRAKDLLDKIGNTQTLAMRLDPLSRVYLEQIIRDFQKLPGAR